FLLLRQPPRPPLFPYTTLFRSSNASSEIELDDAWAILVGEEGKGVRVIIEMVNHTRLDCVIGSASLMRQAVAQATHHTAHRSALDRKSTRLNSSHRTISYAVFC